MIIGVTENYHDYQPKQYFLDTDKLLPSNIVDVMVNNALDVDPNALITKCFIDAGEMNLEEPQITEAAKVNQGPAVKLMHLIIQFE